VLFEGVRFYCGVSERVWNEIKIPQPGAYTCIAPVYGSSARTQRTASVRIPCETRVILDSGAFSDNLTTRLTFAGALERQLKHARRYDYWQQVSHLATYDVLIDEVWTDGNRMKRRWSVEAAESAVDTTVAAAAFADAERHQLEGRGLVVSAQGVDAPQYLRCIERLMPYVQDNDLFGLGGWCIIGKMPKIMMPTFLETVQQVIPFLGREGIRRVHIWGVIYPHALGALLWHADQWGITVSTDSAGPSRNPAFGNWGYGKKELGGWRDNHYIRPESKVRGADRARHVAITRAWLSRLRDTAYYAPDGHWGREPSRGYQRTAKYKHLAQLMERFYVSLADAA
jgi:hypothetical protein